MKRDISIIAEIGSNPVDYGWDFLRFAQAASLAGATHLKAQCFRAEHFPESERAEKKRLEFPRGRIGEFSTAAHANGLKAGLSVFDHNAVTLTFKHCDFVKLAAREESNRELFSSVCSCWSECSKPVLRSISDVKNKKPISFVTHLLAIQEYPAPMWKSLLTLIQARQEFNRWGLHWGWSSHTTGYADCVIAARLGASVIEKHLALSTSDVEAGHSLLPEQFEKMTMWL